MAARKRLPVIAVTMGDVAGVGPEVVAKALLGPKPAPVAAYLIVGDERVLAATCQMLGFSRRAKAWDGHSNLAALGAGVHVRSLTRIHTRDVRMGIVDKRWGAGAMQYVRYAAELAMAKRVDALVTAPISKEATHKAGFHFEGHTDYLAYLAGGPTVRMMFLGPKLRVILATVHTPLARVPRALSGQSILDTICLGGRAMRTLGVESPRIEVCGLNPHAGEAGAFGLEDDKKIRPAVLGARQLGWNVRGPLPADSLFCKTKADLVVAMYHDQGLIPFKMLHFETGVNTTVGLPFIRTSPDHGTAYDIAGKGVADAHSIREAIRWAMVMSEL